MEKKIFMVLKVVPADSYFSVECDQLIAHHVSSLLVTFSVGLV